MTAPNIEMIVESLKNCSLGGVPSPPPPLQPLMGDLTNEKAGVLVELNSHITLPYQWEQCLDMKTGEIYYINWMNGTRTSEDPRKFLSISSSYSSPENDEEDDGDDEDSSDDPDETDETSHSSGLSSLSPPSPTETTDPNGHVLVVAGCQACLTYVMIPKRVQACPKCGGLLLQFDQNR